MAKSVCKCNTATEILKPEHRRNGNKKEGVGTIRIW
jgi:hypothetical protein